MNITRTALLPGISASLVVLALASATLGVTGARAAASAPGSNAAYERERAACITGQSNQDRATCLREAAAARADATRGAAPADEATLRANRLRRCAALPDADRRDCELRMSGAGTQSGSAAEGGIYRELVTREPATQAVPRAPASPASAAN